MNFVTRSAKKSPRLIAACVITALISTIGLASNWKSVTAFALGFSANSKTDTQNFKKDSELVDQFLKTETNLVPQTTLVSSNFETGTFAGEGWTVVNHTTNLWQVGTATNNGGTFGAYISNDAGITNAYTNSTSQTSHFYRDITFPAGEGAIQLSFTWRNLGEGGFDRLLVYTAPTSVTPVAGTPSSSSTTLTGATLISGTQLFGAPSTYINYTTPLPASFAGTTQRLIFTWQNDGSGGTNPPAAVDNISLTSQVQTPVCGTRTVGPTGNYTNLFNALLDLNLNGVSCAVVLELQAAYVGTSETTFPVTFGNIAGNSPTNTITVRPETGAANLSINSSAAGGTFDLNGAANVIIDGRPGGVGTSKQLTISNVSTASSAVRFINEANLNRLQYLNLVGTNSSTTNGVVLFSTTNGANGNDNNTIDNCDIRDGATTPTNGIYASGSTTTTATNNSGNTISNNNIYNYFQAGNSTNGIFISSGNTAWTISGNSFYQTASRTYTSGNTHTGINISNSSGNGFVIQNNFIGGTAPSAGGTPYTILGTIANRYRGISLSVGTTTATSVQGNTVANFAFNSSTGASTTGGPWSGIYLSTGNALIGTVTGNTIGNGTGTGLISATITTTGGISSGIFIDGASVSTISNNIIGSITTAGSTAGVSHGFVGISSPSGTTLTINNNTIGSTTTPNSISAGTFTGGGSATGTTAPVLTGILNSSSATISITNNTIANLNNAYLPTTANVNRIIGGIISSSGTTTITGNTIRNLSTAANATGTGSSASVQGIQYNGSTAPLTISGNTVRALANNNATAAVLVTGIYNFGSSSGTNVIAKNNINNLTTASTAGILNGVAVPGGATTYQNNMIALGGGLTNSAQINGINETGGTNNFYHNSVYIGGSAVVAGAVNTFAFNSTNTGTTRNYRDNIFYNARSNTSGTGAHYAIQVGGTAANPAGLTSNNNILFANGTGGAVGRFNLLTQATLANWQAATGQDGASFSSDPQYLDATNAIPDLHLHPTNATVAEGNGADVGVTDDFDSQTRSSFTPVDIGADAGNFIGAGDFGAPTIIYTALTNTSSTTSRVQTISVTDSGSGVPTSGIGLPVIYFNKNGGSYFGSQCVFVSGSTFNCTLDYALVGGVVVTDTIRYYVAAQDLAGTPNVGVNPSAGAGGLTANPPAAGTPPVTPNQYSIVTTFTGSVNVGTGETITSLTNAGGLFERMNAGTISGNVTVNITSDLTSELGTVSLNQQAEEGAGNWTITFSPSGGVQRLISGGNATLLINLNGADRIVFDGLNTGGNSLVIRNTSTGSAMRMIADASSNTIQNCTLEGSAGSTVVSIGAGTTTGNDSVTITSNTIRDRSDIAAVPATLIGNAGSSSAITNSGTVITDNQLFNFSSSGINSSNAENVNYSGNTIYQTAARTTSLTPMTLTFTGGTNTISQNVIRNQSTTGSLTAMNFGDVRNTTVSRNRIYNLDNSTGSTSTFTGINFGGGSGTPASVTLVNNMISIIPTTNSSQTIYGIRDFGFTGNTFNVYYNSILIGGTATGAATWAYQRGGSTPTITTLTNNIFFNNRTGGSVNHFAAGDASANAGVWSSNYNIFIVPGTGTAIAVTVVSSCTGTIKSLPARSSMTEPVGIRRITVPALVGVA